MKLKGFLGKCLQHIQCIQLYTMHLKEKANWYNWVKNVGFVNAAPIVKVIIQII